MVYTDIKKKFIKLIFWGEEDSKVIYYKKLASNIIESLGNWHFQFRKAKKVIMKTTNEKSCLVWGDHFTIFECREAKTLLKEANIFRKNHS